MSRIVSPEARKALQAQTTGDVFLVCIKVSHSDWADSLRMVENNEEITVLSEVYLPIPFKFTPPVEEDGTLKQSQLSIANTSQALIAELRQLEEGPTCSAFVIRASAPDVIEVGPWDFDMRNIQINALELVGELYPAAPLLRLSSATLYKNNTFPGLYG